jgi:hypothetical protein
MKIKKGIHNEASVPQQVHTPMRVAPRLSSEVKRMRVRDKKNSVSGRK